jgi:hypothetical protein
MAQSESTMTPPSGQPEGETIKTEDVKIDVNGADNVPDGGLRIPDGVDSDPSEDPIPR